MDFYKYAGYGVACIILLFLRCGNPGFSGGAMSMPTFCKVFFKNLKLPHMKKHFQKICNRLTIALVLLLSYTTLTAQKKLTIDSETLASIQKIYGNQDFKIYPVTSNETEINKYVSGEVKTKLYDALLELRNKYKPEYDKYLASKLKDSILQVDIKHIINNINKYLSSSEKADVKDAYILGAQELANKNEIKIKGENTSLFAKQLSEHGISEND